MIRVALEICGHVRNLEENFESLKKNILEPYKPDVFFSLWESYGWRSEGNKITLGNDVSSFKGFDFWSGKVDQAKIIDLLQPKSFLFENFIDKEQEFNEQAEKHKPNCGDHRDRPINTIGLAYKLYNCNQLKKQYEQQNGFKYDIIIRTRPDMVYYNQPIDSNIYNLITNNILVTPELCSYGIASDIMAIGTSEVIDQYAELYNKLDELNDLKINMNPHYMLQYYFNKTFPSKWVIYNLPIALNRCRKGKKTCGDKLQCNQCDPGLHIVSNIKE